MLWQCLELFLRVVTRGLEARDAAEHPTMHRDPVPDVRIVVVGKPHLRDKEERWEKGIL